jgi:hypothetical protein
MPACSRSPWLTSLLWTRLTQSDKTSSQRWDSVFKVSYCIACFTQYCGFSSLCCGSGSCLSLWSGSGSCLSLCYGYGSYLSLWCGSGSGSGSYLANKGSKGSHIPYLYFGFHQKIYADLDPDYKLIRIRLITLFWIRLQILPFRICNTGLTLINFTRGDIMLKRITCNALCYFKYSMWYCAK